MRRTKLTAGLSLFLVAGAGHCYNPDLDGQSPPTRFRCTGSGKPGDCPVEDDVSCRDANPDLGVMGWCLKPSDPSRPVGPTADGGPSSGPVCVPFGTQGKVLACTGTFDAGKADTLCPPNSAPYAGAITGDLATACADQRLAQEGIFYAVNVAGAADPSMPLTRGSCFQVAGWTGRVSGCGEVPGATAKMPTCAGWPSAVVCALSGGAWDCPMGQLSLASNKNPRHGVLCLKF